MDNWHSEMGGGLIPNRRLQFAHPHIRGGAAVQRLSYYDAFVRRSESETAAPYPWTRFRFRGLRSRYTGPLGRMRGIYSLVTIDGRPPRLRDDIVWRRTPRVG